MRHGTHIAAAFALSSASLAAEGKLEINQTCATQVGCFSGDTAGFPVTIDGTAGRSYRLTSDLATPLDVSLLVISANDVSVDLGGFRIQGPNVCQGVRCSQGVGSGVAVASPAVSGVEVYGGSVVGMLKDGVSLGPRAVVRDLRVMRNRGDGIAVLNGGLVRDNVVFDAQGIGVVAGLNSSISRNSVSENLGIGIRATRCAVEGNVASNNGEHGIEATGGSLRNNTTSLNAGHGIAVELAGEVSGNAATLNDGAGIELRESPGCTVRGNTASSNGGGGIIFPEGTVFDTQTSGCSVLQNTASNNGGDGIHAPPGSLVQGNTATDNSQAGLRIQAPILATPTGYRENVLDGGVDGPVVGGVNLGSNLCGLTVTCP